MLILSTSQRILNSKKQKEQTEVCSFFMKSSLCEGGGCFFGLLAIYKINPKLYKKN